MFEKNETRNSHFVSLHEVVVRVLLTISILLLLMLIISLQSACELQTRERERDDGHKREESERVDGRNERSAQCEGKKQTET